MSENQNVQSDKQEQNALNENQTLKIDYTGFLAEFANWAKNDQSQRKKIEAFKIEEQKYLNIPGTPSNWKMLISSKSIQERNQVLADQLNAKFKDWTEPITMIGVLSGCYMFASDLGRLLDFNLTTQFLRVSSYTGQERGKITIEELGKVKGTIILIDELVDSGSTFATLTEQLRLNPQVNHIFTCAMFAKTHSPLPDFCGFPGIPELWLLGYGLDENGTKRNWPVLFACPKLPGIKECPEDVIFKEAEDSEDILAFIRSKINRNPYMMARGMFVGYYTN